MITCNRLNGDGTCQKVKITHTEFLDHKSKEIFLYAKVLKNMGWSQVAIEQKFAVAGEYRERFWQGVNDEQEKK